MARSIAASVERACSYLRDQRRLVLLLVAAALAFRAFWEVAEELLEGGLLPFDLTLQAAIRPYHTPALDSVATALSALPKPPWVLVLASPFLAYLGITRRYRAAVWLIATPLATVVLVETLKLIFHRDRPLTAEIAEIGYSFPSGHATGATVLYGCLGYIAWRYWASRSWSRAATVSIATLLIAGTGLARVYLEVHYPSDVAAGWAAGLCVLSAAIIIHRQRLTPRPGTP